MSGMWFRDVRWRAANGLTGGQAYVATLPHRASRIAAIGHLTTIEINAPLTSVWAIFADPND